MSHYSLILRNVIVHFDNILNLFDNHPGARAAPGDASRT